MLLLVCVGACVAAYACGGSEFSAGAGDGGGDSTLDDASPLEAAADAPPAVDAPSLDGAHPLDAAHDGQSPPVDASEAGDARPPITVSGVVVDEFLSPLSGVSIAVGLGGTLQNTDQKGAFSFSGVHTPYSLAIITRPAGGGAHAYYFYELTTAAPVLQLADDISPAIRGAALGGSLPDAGAGSNSLIYADMPAGSPAAGSNAVLGFASPYSDSVSWIGSSSVAATLHFLQWNAAGTFVGFSAAAKTLGQGTNTWNPGVGTAPGNAMLKVSFSKTAGYDVDVSVYVQPQNATGAPLLRKAVNQTSPVSVKTPQATGVTFVACATQYPPGDAGAATPFGAACQSGLSASATPTLAPPVWSTVKVPGSVDVTSEFTWTGHSSAVYSVLFVPTQSTLNQTSFRVVTATANATIPDFSHYSLPLPSAASYSVAVRTYQPYTTIDDAVTAAGFAGPAISVGEGRGPLKPASATFTFSGPTVFTTK